MLTEVGDYTGSEWKLTIKDDARIQGFEASCKEWTGNEVAVEYSGAQTGDNEFISAVIVNSDRVVTHYGPLAKATGEASSQPNGKYTVTVTLPEGFSDGDTLYVFNEQVNGDKKTDYASELVEITKPTLEAHSVTVEGGTANPTTACAGDTVTITANTPEDGKAFVQWAPLEGVDFAQDDAATTTFAMPATDVTVSAVFAPIIIGDIDNKVYTGNPIKPLGEVHVSLDGVDLALTADDYEVSFEDNLNAGDAKVIVTMKSPHAGSQSTTFTIEACPSTRYSPSWDRI